MVSKFSQFISESNREFEYLLSERFQDILKLMSRSSSDDILINLISKILNSHHTQKDNITYLDSTDKNDNASFFALDKLFQIYYERENLTGDRNFKKISDETFNSFIDWLPSIYGSDLYNRKLWIWTDTKRTDINVGRLFVKILKKLGVSHHQSNIDELINLYKSSYDKINGNKTFQLVEGDDILTSYLEDNYDVKSGQLINSCMRLQKCQEYLNIYCKNPDKVKLLVLKLNPDSDKIIGRALIWTLDNGKTYMDRAYTSFNSDIDLYKTYAKERDYLTYYVSKSDMSVSLKEFDFERYPYMDTLIYLDMDGGVLSNIDNGDCRKLQSTDGTWENVDDDDENYVYSERYGENIPREDAVWCVDIDDFVYPDDAQYVEYAGAWYIEGSDDCVYSKENEGYILDKDAVRSEYLDDWLLDYKSSQIYTSSKLEEEDYVPNSNEFKIIEDTISGEKTLDIFCYKIINDGETEYYFKDWELILIPNDEKFSGIKVNYHGSEWIIFQSIYNIPKVSINLDEIDSITISIEEYLGTLNDKSLTNEEYLENLKTNANIDIYSIFSSNGDVYPLTVKIANKIIAYCFANPKLVDNCEGHGENFTNNNSEKVKRIFSNDEIIDNIFDSNEREFITNKIDTFSYKLIDIFKDYEKYSYYFLDSPEMIKFYNNLKKKTVEINERRYYPYPQ